MHLCHTARSCSLSVLSTVVNFMRLKTWAELRSGLKKRKLMPSVPVASMPVVEESIPAGAIRHNNEQEMLIQVQRKTKGYEEGQEAGHEG